MIYPRRALQRRLDELRNGLDGDVVDELAKRLNRPGKDRVAAMWEVVVLHGLLEVGNLQNEAALPSGRRPDIKFCHGKLRFTADVTAVSDDGLDNNNPYHELSELIEKAKRKLNLPIGGLNVVVRAKHDRTKRGIRPVLMLPPHKQLQKFVSETLVPRLRKQIDNGETVLRVAIDDDKIGLEITIDPSKSPYNSGSFAAYDTTKIKDCNPLYHALRGKAGQLRGAEGLTGVIVGDGDCVALSARSAKWDEISTPQIVAEFFRQFSSIDFVLLLSILETKSGFGAFPPPLRENVSGLFVRPECEASEELKSLFDAMVTHFPRPAMTPVNGALRAREHGYDLGHHGGYTMSGSKVRIGLREFTEIFAGLRTLRDNGAKHVEAARSHPQVPNPVQAIVVRNLMEGRLPTSIEIIKTDENDNDDWVEIRFGEIDPAIAPLR